jgi:hypothetical protein
LSLQVHTHGASIFIVSVSQQLMKKDDSFITGRCRCKMKILQRKPT